MTETLVSTVDSLVERVEELGAEVASLRRALFSLGSNLAGGPPGVKGYIAWHEDQVKSMPIPVPVWAELRQDGPTLQEWTQAGYPATAYPPPGYAPKGPTASVPGTTPAPGAPSSSEPSTLPSQPVSSGTTEPSTDPSSPPSGSGTAAASGSSQKT